MGAGAKRDREILISKKIKLFVHIYIHTYMYVHTHVHIEIDTYMIIYTNTFTFTFTSENAHLPALLVYVSYQYLSRVCQVCGPRCARAHTHTPQHVYIYTCARVRLKYTPVLPD